jgi:hypothetical protein
VFKGRRETFWASTGVMSSSKQLIYFKKCMSMSIMCAISAANLYSIFSGDDAQGSAWQADGKRFSWFVFLGKTINLSFLVKLGKVKLDLQETGCKDKIPLNGSTILDLSTRWRWVVCFTLRLLNPWEIDPGTHWIGGWVGPRAGLNAVEKKILALPEIEPRLSSPSLFF